MEDKKKIKAKNINYNSGEINGGIIIVGDRNINNINTQRTKIPGVRNFAGPPCYESFEEPYIFISYSHKDIKRVLPIINLLKNNKYRVWYDNDIQPGRKWDKCIETRLKNSSIFISFISRFYWKSGACIEEISFACTLPQYNTDGIIPVYLDDFMIPDDLGLQMHLSPRQSIFGYKYSTPEEVYKMICKNKGIFKCQENKGNQLKK